MSLINTRIQNLRAASNLDKFELRPSRYGALDLFVQQTTDPSGIITPELAALAEKSIGSILQTPVIDYDAGITIGNTRSVTIADSENTSQMVTITFATYSWGFTSVPAMFMNNEISMQRDFNNKFTAYLYKFASTLDTAALTALATAKTQVFSDSLNYSVVGNALQATWAQRETVIGDINPIMSANDFYGQIHLVGNAGIDSMIRNLAEKGIYNSENKTLEYSDKILHFTTKLVNAEGKFATAYAVQGGSLGMLTRFEREALLRTQARTGHEWDIETLPMLNMPVGTYYYDTVGDYNAIAGAATADMTRVRKEHFGFSVDVAFITAYNSSPSTLASPIMKIEIAEKTAADTMQVVVANTTANPVITQEVGS